jgi:uncharacterized protein GlcG (DUF336 family)
MSIKKAYRSRAFDIATKDLAEHPQSGGQFFGIHASNDRKIMIFAGGILLERDGKVLGAIGVRGAPASSIMQLQKRTLLPFNRVSAVVMFARSILSSTIIPGWVVRSETREVSWSRGSKA